MSIKEKVLIALSFILTLGALASEITFFTNYTGTSAYKIGAGLDFEVGLGILLFIITLILLVSRPKAFYRMLKIQFAMLCIGFLVLAVTVHNQESTLTKKELRAYTGEK